MTDAPTKPNAVQYAEQVLGVHVPWEDAQDAIRAHDEFSHQVETLRVAIRGTKQRIEDRKLEIATDAPSTEGYPADGVQKQRDFVKVLLAMDEDLAELESLLATQESERDHADMGRKHQEQRLYACTARMNELGGLLHFYAAAKAAEAAQAERDAHPVLTVARSSEVELPPPPRTPFS